MSKNIVLNGETFNNASYIKTKSADGGTALFRDTSEIVTPSGRMEITENGEFDVTNYAQALVNVAGGGGAIQPITGYVETKANNQTFLYLPVGQVDTDKFLVVLQLVESGTYATSGDNTSNLTMDETVSGYDAGTWIVANVLYFTQLFDSTVEYQQAIPMQNGAIGRITTGNKAQSLSADIQQEYSDGVLVIKNLGYSTGHVAKYLKYKYTVYPLG